MTCSSILTKCNNDVTKYTTQISPHQGHSMSKLFLKHIFYFCNKALMHKTSTDHGKVSKLICAIDFFTVPRSMEILLRIQQFFSNALNSMQNQNTQQLNVIPTNPSTTVKLTHNIVFTNVLWSVKIIKELDWNQNTFVCTLGIVW